MSLRTISLGMSEVGIGPCKVRNDGNCPDQDSPLPSCHKCPIAKEDHTEFAAAHSGQIHKYNGTGTISTIGEVRNREYYVLKHNGDGPDHRRVSISREKI